MIFFDLLAEASSNLVKLFNQPPIIIQPLKAITAQAVTTSTSKNITIRKKIAAQRKVVV